MLEQTCVLFFTRTPHQESKYKQLFGRKRQNLRAFSLLHQQTKQTLRQSGLTFQEFTETQQRGETFGERLTTGIQALFRQGYQNLIIVGNDCPDLTVDDLLEADAALKSGKQVVGADHKGGAYLIGLRKSVFDPTGFQALPWQRSQLIAALSDYLQATTSLFTLSIKRDLNSHQQIVNWLSGSHQSSLLASLRGLLSPTWIFTFDLINLQPSRPDQTITFRGPPQLT